MSCEIRIIGDEILRKKAKPVKKITKSIRKLIEEMIESMRDNYGVGLAAPQIGKNLRVVVIELDEENDPKGKGRIYTAINPEILKKEGEVTKEEGCLSVPGVYAPVTRAAKVRVTFLDENGKRVTLDCDGLLSQAFQHEIDHLDGILFVDRVVAPLGDVERIASENAKTLRSQRASSRRED